MTDHFNPATPGCLPTPGCPLLVILEDGTTRKAVRPNYILDREDDPQYEDMDGNPLTGVKRWRYL